MVNSIADIDFLYVIVLGILLGAAELMGRYRDDPGSVFRAPPTWIYLGVNGFLAAVSLFLIHKLGLNITPSEGGAGDPEQTARIYNIMAAGFGGAAFFRSSVMKTKVGDTDVAIGPAIVIDTLLRVTDREVDRYRAEARAAQIADLVKDLNLAQASGVILPFCTALMQNMSAAEREALQKEARAFATEDIASETKPKIVALRLVNIVGFRVLERAVAELKKSGDLSTARKPGFGKLFGGDDGKAGAQLGGMLAGGSASKPPAEKAGKDQLRFDPPPATAPTGAGKAAAAAVKAGLKPAATGAEKPPQEIESDDKQDEPGTPPKTH